MSRALLGIVALGAIAIVAARPVAVRSDAVQVGEAAPSVLIATLDGQSVTADFHGLPAYINFFATWCEPCRGELPAIVDQAKQYRDRVVFLFVDEQESATLAKGFVSPLRGIARIAVDRGQFAAAFDVGGLPWSIFIDRHGIVRYIYRGRIPPAILGDQLSKLISS
jgi:cytochrome c biogenesis protein CcmG, thiol:disulfide interchange protein DsbE